jgi:ubiquinone/menaquinone biosynthesis C-methylase UbiE
MDDLDLLACLESAGALERVESNLWRDRAIDSKHQSQTSRVFAEKWKAIDYKSEDFARAFRRQRKWYLELYGFESERALAGFLRSSPAILDAGTGTGAKASWFASLAPDSLVIAAEISDSIYEAASQYRTVENLRFVKCDISELSFIPDDSFDYVSCDQVIHHTAAPETTFQELVRVTRARGDLSCYVYRRKAILRELLDEKCRELFLSASHDELFSLAEQVTELGKVLDTVKGELDFPEIPALEIVGGRMSLQRFVYWNFLKCYWNPEMGHKNSVLTNFDWYGPSQAFRYREEEFMNWIVTNGLETMHFHRESACYSGRFRKPRHSMVKE